MYLILQHDRSQMSNITQSEHLSHSATKTLFRQQVLDSFRSRHYGSILLKQRPHLWILVAIITAMCCAIVLFLFLGSVTRKSQCYGVLLPTSGLIRISVPQTGTIVEKRVKEGEKVKAGQVLFVLSSELISDDASGVQTRVLNIIEQRKKYFQAEAGKLRDQYNSKLASTEKNIASLTTEIDRRNEQLDLQKKRVKIAEAEFVRFKKLQENNYISSAQLESKQAEVLDQRQKVSDIENNIRAIGRDLDSASADLKTLNAELQRESSSIERSINLLDQEIAENRAKKQVLITAPSDGTATSITSEPGKYVTAGVVLASLVPDGSVLEAELYAPSRSIGFVRPGMTALLRYDAFPYEKFGQYEATISEISRTPIPRSELPMPEAIAGGTNEPVYRIKLRLRSQTIKVYGSEIPLNPGMLVQASIRLEKKKIYELILEPLFAIKGKMAL